jgi:two-component system chemotaxis response regulator CheB
MTLEEARLRQIEAVAIGASAGGVQALLELLPALRADQKLTVFVVLHLPRDRPSLLVDVFTPKCALQVREAQDKEPAARGTIYFAPPNYHLLIDSGPRLSLSADDLVNHSRPSIDVLFESAADIYRERLLGIILTGANEDGAAGLAAVHDAGGITVVQEPLTAQSTLMVRSALELRTPDLVLDLTQVAELLGGLASDTASRLTA